MVAAKGLTLGSVMSGTLMPAAEAFVAQNTPSQQISGLRGASAASARPASTPSGSAPLVMSAAAAGMALAGGFTGKRRASLRTSTSRRAAAEEAKAAKEDAPKEDAPPPPPAFDKTMQIGAQDPIGFWDPLDFCKDEATFRDLRAKELKHGRAAMMGSVGMLTQSLVQVPGMEGVPKSCKAILVGNGMVGGIAVLALIGVLEAFVFVQDEKKEPGNFGNPLPWFDDYSDEMRAREIANGRVAMFAAIGQIAAGLYTGKDALQQFGI